MAHHETDRAHDRDRASDLRALARLFLQLGCTGFGGPQAHMALMAEAVVERRRWLSAAEFAEGIAICEMLPGPASTQLGIYVGYQRAGAVGALLAGVCFIAPAFGLVVLLAFLYFRFQGLPATAGLMFGVAPVVVAAIAAFCWKLARKTLTKRSHWAIAIAVLLAVLLRFNVLVAFLLAGLVGIALYSQRQPPGLHLRSPGSVGGIIAIAPLIVGVAPAAEGLAAASFWGVERLGDYGLDLAWFFLRAGSLVFGGGLTIVPLLEFEVVQRFGWLTSEEFLNGVAIGQLTPGPVLLAVAFVGYKVAGVLGALIATLAAFAPSFAFIMAAAPVLQRLRQRRVVQAFLQGVTPAALGAVAAAAMPLGRAALVIDRGSLFHSAIAVVLLIVAAIALVRGRRPLWQLLPIGGAIGLLVGAP